MAFARYIEGYKSKFTISGVNFIFTTPEVNFRFITKEVNFGFITMEADFRVTITGVADGILNKKSQTATADKKVMGRPATAAATQWQ
ncbi:hypothetical protein HAX54_051839, partial [Datura stramonium]|nr:hypothetical protein [Datura stramonium]